MKRGWTKKVKAVPACAASNDALEGRCKLVQPKVKRRVRTSAAMIGLVISMGAPNLVLTRESNRAPAAEVIGNEPTITTVPATTEAAQSGSVNSVKPEAASVPAPGFSSAVGLPTHRVQLKKAVLSAPLELNQGGAAAISQLAPPPVVKPVQKRQTSRQSQNYQMDGADSATLAAGVSPQQFSAEGVGVGDLANLKVATVFSEGVKIDPSNSNTQYAEIQTEKVLKSHQVNPLVQRLKAGKSKALSQSHEVENTQITPLPVTTAANQSLLDNSVTVSGVNVGISAKQRVLINRLKQKSNRSQDNLMQLSPEESSTPLVATFAQPASTLTKAQTPNEVSVDSVIVGVEGQQNTTSALSIVTSNNAGFELQQSPPISRVNVSDRQSAVPTPDAAIIAPQAMSDPAVQTVAERSLAMVTSNENAVSELQQSPPAARVNVSDWQSAAPTPDAAIIAPQAMSDPAVQTVAERSLAMVTSNENAVSELQQSPPAARVNVSDWQSAAPTPDAAIIAPQEVSEPTVQNVAEPPAIVTSNDAGLEAQNVEPTPEAVVADIQDAVNEPTVIGTASPNYQVKAGDTLTAIARNHGVALSELVKANQLSDPNLIEINQQIKVPTQYSSALGRTITVINRPTQPEVTASNVAISTPKTVSSQTVFVIPPLSPASNSSVSIPTLPITSKIQTTTELTASRSAADSQQESSKVPPEILAETPSLGAAYSGMGGSISDDEADQLITPADHQTQLADSTAAIEPQSNLSVQDLQTDIQKLRQKYSAQRQGSQLASVVNETIRVAAPVQISARSTAAVSSNGINPQVSPLLANQPINPEFRVAQAAETLRPNLQKRASTQPSSAVAPKAKARVATAPSTVDASEAIQSFRGRQVSPELPPLGEVDNYLPKPTSVPLKGYIWPAKGVLTSGYGWRWGRMHKGIDVAAPIGTPIVAAAPGVVVKAGWNSGGYGKLVDIKHADGTLTRYAHNNRIVVQAGQQVEQGQRISEMGSTGFSTGPHLHFEVHPGGKKAVNPIAFLPGR